MGSCSTKETNLTRWEQTDKGFVRNSKSISRCRKPFDTDCDSRPNPQGEFERESGDSKEEMRVVRLNINKYKDPGNVWFTTPGNPVP